MSHELRPDSRGLAHLARVDALRNKLAVIVGFLACSSEARIGVGSQTEQRRGSGEIGRQLVGRRRPRKKPKSLIGLGFLGSRGTA
jgi:hypothetical protein